MLIVRPGDKIDKLIAEKSIFLAGPTPRDIYGIDWRIEALDILDFVGYDHTVFIPAPFMTLHQSHAENYYHQIDWEDRALRAATVILFWVPRELQTMPGFTTNVEFGMYIKSDKIVYGRPEGSPKTGYLDWHAVKNNVPIVSTLAETITTAINLL